MTDPLTADDLDASEQRAHQWASPLSIKCPACGSRPGDLCYGNGPMRRPHEQRREAVRQRVIDDVPALLAEVRRLRAMEQRVQEYARHLARPFADGVPDWEGEQIASDLLAVLDGGE